MVGNNKNPWQHINNMSIRTPTSKNPDNIKTKFQKINDNNGNHGSNKKKGFRTYRLTLDSSVSNSIRKRIPTETRVWYTALTYLARDMTNSDGQALHLRQDEIENKYGVSLKKKYISPTLQRKLPWIVEYDEAAISGSRMSCRSKKPKVHAVTW